MSTCDLSELRGLFIFEGLTDAQLSTLCADGWVQTYPAGELCREGEPADYFYVLLDGEVALSKRSGTRDIDIWRAGTPGSYFGAWSAFLLDEDTTYENTATLTRPSRVLAIPATTLGNLLVNEFQMATHLLVGHSHGRFHQRRILGPHDRLVQLGQMTAGLTHELNNPAAAAVRAANGLRTQIAGMRHRRAELPAAVAPEAMDSLVELQDRVAEIAGKPKDLSAVEKSDLEEALGQWLEGHGVEGAWDHAAIFAEAGLDIDWMERISTSPCCGDGTQALTAVIRWLSSTAETELLLTEITDATKRISTLVDQAKQYTQLDRAPSDMADVHELLESTLAMLSHRLGPAVSVVRDFDLGLPQLPCYPAELNQVWTNLIDNALDAMGAPDGSAGVLTLRTRRERDMVRVEVCDTGPGIPDDVLARIFDPFFTTKPFGEGTGLGLDIAARIVDRHLGSLWAESIPGDTRFITALPLQAAQNLRASADDRP
ncbi:ATP-binding protein [Mycolicibacterium sp. BiH015]|uniref:ATP-binding protein n=1 Tax=Mycolicibacterium sp. BiH015 TaxID=3018808 RepID=UPI0022E31B39|nr:ATP-binding protein [Mycolicibacterium sp. BiH015]MDA2895016.1 ATP-binding protein [Mycolicibacterium sp. BiH015]